MSDLNWITELPEELTGTATIALARPSETTTYRVQKFGENFLAVLLVEMEGGGTINNLIGQEFESEEKARAAAMADWNERSRS